jgi:hypothetical protein
MSCFKYPLYAISLDIGMLGLDKTSRSQKRLRQSVLPPLSLPKTCAQQPPQHAHKTLETLTTRPLSPMPFQCLTVCTQQADMKIKTSPMAGG